MRKILVLLFLMIAAPAFAGSTFNPFTGKPDKIPTIQEEDGDPAIQNCMTIKFPNANVTDNGDGTCSIADQTGAGGGDEITVNTTAATNANFLDNIYVDWTLVTASTPDDITAKYNYAETLAGDPALLVDECIFAKDLSGGFFLCEGSTADTAEQAYRFPDLNGSDTTEYILVTTTADKVGDAQIADGAVDGGTGGEIADGSVTADDLGTASVSADELNATGVETELEAALDIDGEVSSTGMGTTVLDETGISLTSITVGALLGVDSIDATGAVDMDYGSADITDHTFVTDSTGDAEIVLPNDSIGVNEIGDDAILESMLKAVDAAADEECLTKEDTTGDFEWQPCGSGSGTTSFPLYPYSGKLTGLYVTATITNLDVASQGAQIDAGDGNWRALYDASTDEAMVFYGIIPSNYGSVPVVNLIYSLNSATANEVEWEAAIQCVTPGDAADIATASFAAGATSGGLTVPGTAGHTDTLASITPTDDSCAAHDLIYVYISTDADDATNDDATGDRELVGAYVSYTP